jgi:probable DNA metabolism protein
MSILKVFYYYDKSFDGLLTAVFESFERRQMPDNILGSGDVAGELWGETVKITSDANKAGRVWQALVGKISDKRANILFRIHFSGIEAVDMPLFRLIRNIFLKGPDAIDNYADPDVLLIKKADRRVSREAERVAQFVRFQKTADGIYYASYGPDFDVIPMVLGHFRDRFANQPWMIYDIKRKKGYYYNGHNIQWVTLQSSSIDSASGEADESILADDELLFQKLWRQYFRSICIDERLNLNLHRQKMPKKYWKYLVEKKH